jgi:hypothetical protein
LFLVARHKWAALLLLRGIPAPVGHLLYHRVMKGTVFHLKRKTKGTSQKESGTGVAIPGGKKFQVSYFLILKNL